jgi:hypothetical protein
MRQELHWIMDAAACIRVHPEIIPITIKKKAVPQYAMEAHRGRGGIAPTHT